MIISFSTDVDEETVEHEESSHNTPIAFTDESTSHDGESVTTTPAHFDANDQETSVSEG